MASEPSLTAASPSTPVRNAMAGAVASVRAGGWPMMTLALMGAIALLYTLKLVFLPIFVALYLTFTLAPIVRVLRRYGLSDGIAALLVVASLLLALALLIGSVAGPANAWLQRAPSDVQQLQMSWNRVRTSIPLIAPPAQHAQPAAKKSRNEVPPPPPPDPIAEKIATESFTLTRTVIAKFASFALSFAATVMLLFFLLASERWLLTATVAALPQRRPRCAVVGGVRHAQREIARYLAAQTIINIGLGIAVGLAMYAIGLPNPTLWGALIAVLNFIPYLGPLAYALLLGLAGILTFNDFAQMMAPVFAFLVITFIESNLISPWFVGRRLRISPLAVFLAVLFWGGLWGIGGAVIAVPTLIAFRSACRRRKSLHLWCAYLDPPNAQAPSLRRLLARATTARAKGSSLRTPRST